ncbi:MAG: LytTR family transcriptional regulator [Desulfarculaceae bacterium]|nr:LytTR family transcriptional regulator [Desulfarculaceae bacterium]MCF8074491.1 LytTR family transcriptional regulator [Desulfarculaceae bacterium]MCF8103590.1 LytTR family transcriptional regulator [Desulfarculaceae bacterium]MCF8118380.1 LytTR family transcriptional regulator [Desulfarculaceae bacterium]
MAVLASFPAPLRGLWHLPQAYLRRPLGCFCAHPTHRRLLYYQLGLFFLMAVLAGKALLRQHGFMIDHLTFYFTYALHLSLTYLVGVILAEVAVRLFLPRWSAYEKRTVARQWAVWGLGFLLGFALHRFVMVHLVGYYAPWLVAYLSRSPHLRPSLLNMLLFSGAAWTVATFAVIRSALAWQKVLRQRAAAARPAAPAQPAEAPAAPAPAPALGISHDGRRSRIPLARITHVTVEDHYCRVHYLDSQGPGNLFACMTLKSLAEQLPEKDFIQIHRSHLVNLRYVSGLKRSEGQYLAVLPASGAELPISRRRRAEFQKRLSGRETNK